MLNNYSNSLRKQTHWSQVAWCRNRDWTVTHSLLQSWVQVHVCSLLRNNSYSLLVEKTALTAEKFSLYVQRKRITFLCMPLAGGHRRLHSSHSPKFIFCCDKTKSIFFFFLQNIIKQRRDCLLLTKICIIKRVHTVKGKVIPVQAVEDPRVERGRGSHIFRYSAHRWRLRCQPYAPATFHPQEDSWSQPRSHCG
jgi:hypothetical protein